VCDKLEVTGNIDFTGCTLDVTRIGTPAAYPYIIASWTGTRTGTLTVPSNVTVTYNDTAKTAQITNIVATPFDTWIGGFFPSGGSEVIGQDADPDGDGQSNIMEFALGGAPNSGGDNAKVFPLAADGSVDADATAELLMTIAVRNGGDGNGGAPVFSGSPLTATIDGVVYTIQGSTTLSSFPTAVTAVNAVLPAGAPAAPAGYEYRTFSLNGSNGVPSRGFLRVNVSAAP
jgi:hypothetical protein